MSDTLIAIRVGASQWLTTSALDRTLRFLDRYPGTVDEIAFFTSDTHPPLPLGEIERRAGRLYTVLAVARQHGYGAGINILSSMGHHEENLPYSLTEPWQRVVDPDGQVCLGSYCPGSPDLLHYVDQLYTLLARTGPDFLWIDDDVRLLGHLPIRATCFCADCIARFNSETQGAFTRDSLVGTLLGSASQDRDEWRARWLEHNRTLITRFLGAIGRAVHRVDSSIQLGFMTGDRFYEGYAFPEWAGALEGSQAGPPRWRPGGGFYADDRYFGLVEKAHDVGRQVSQLPARLTIIQSEIENFPYQKLRKSVEVTVLEAGAHMAAGATGPAFNLLSQHKEALDEYEPFLDRITQVRPFYAALREVCGRTPNLGVWPAWNRDIYADHGADDDWFRENRNLAALRRPYTLAEIGIPVAYSQDGARVTAFAGTIPASFKSTELEAIFRGGVILDGEALQSLERLGVSEWAGVRVAEKINHDAIEVLAEHPLNGEFAGWERNCRQSFWPQPAYRLEENAPGVKALARLTDYGGNDLGTTMTAYENRLGGRVVVMGYYPWTLIHNRAKSSQLKAVSDWCSHLTLPVVVPTYAKVVVWARQGDAGRLALVLLNASLDPVPELVLRVRTTARQAEYQGMNRVREIVPVVQRGTNEVEIVLHDLAPWSMHLFRF